MKTVSNSQSDRSRPNKRPAGLLLLKWRHCQETTLSTSRRRRCYAKWWWMHRDKRLRLPASTVWSRECHLRVCLTSGFSARRLTVITSHRGQSIQYHRLHRRRIICHRCPNTISLCSCCVQPIVDTTNFCGHILQVLLCSHTKSI